ncbi:MAG: aldolase/citrate lyase family protein [Thermodesulfobacteriota bacterium]
MSRLKQRLDNGEVAVGTFVSEVRNPNLGYMLAQSGFDFFILDNEHGAFSWEAMGAMIAGARGANIDVVVRAPEIRREVILKPLDLGAAGLLVPMVDEPDQAREVLRHAKYPPQGARGLALRRAHNMYRKISAPEHLAQANADTFIAVQAESPRAVANAAAIAAVEGVDAIFVGPMDLSVSMGIAGQTGHPQLVEAVEKVIAACAQAGVAPGLLTANAPDTVAWIKKGIRFVAYGSDVTLLADGAAAAISTIKGASPA